MGPLGMQELIVIFVIALLVFGPRKLPELGRSLGKGLREFKRATNEMKATWDDQMRDVENEVRSTGNEIRNVGRDMKKSLEEPPARPSQTTSTPKTDTVAPTSPPPGTPPPAESGGADADTQPETESSTSPPA